MILSKVKFSGSLFTTLILLLNFLSINIYAWQGDMGYDGSISTGQQPNKTTADCKEVMFISGEPIELTGTVVMKKSLKKDNTTGKDGVTTVYTYSLKNTKKSATLTRVITYYTILDKKDNGQIVETTTLPSNPVETYKVGNKTFSLKSMEFTRSCLVDPKPAIEYYTGNFMWKKNYSVTTASTGTGAAGGSNTNSTTPTPGTVNLTAAGNTTGFNQYWGSAETIKYDLSIKSEDKKSNTVDRWEGTASLKNSYSKSTDITYQENEATPISFDGGYIKETTSKSILEYKCKIPEFDTNGISTYNILEKEGMLTLDTFPVAERLRVPNSSKIRGHWAQKDVDQLLSLEIFNYDMDSFDPEENMNRGEFADALVRAVKEVPKDPVFTTGLKAPTKAATTKAATTKNTAKTTIFSDVPADYLYLDTIESAFKRGMISGKGNGTFSPDEFITFSDAVTILIRTLGLEQVSKWRGNVTIFKDNNDIPSYARDHIYAANKIGLIKGDTNGYIRPNERISKARGAAIINRLIDFMRSNLIKEYTEKLINY